MPGLNQININRFVYQPETLNEAGNILNCTDSVINLKILIVVYVTNKLCGKIKTMRLEISLFSDLFEYHKRVVFWITSCEQLDRLSGSGRSHHGSSRSFSSLQTAGLKDRSQSCQSSLSLPQRYILEKRKKKKKKTLIVSR